MNGGVTAKVQIRQIRFKSREISIFSQKSAQIAHEK